jgi:NitT/TauT family transport system ATP-binding protein
MMRAVALHKDFRVGRNADRVRVLDGLTFEIAAGEIGCLVGPIGCGKSTLLRIVAGLESASAGEVQFKSQDAELERPRCVLLPQGSPLLPWRTVQENLWLASDLAGRRRTPQRGGIIDQIATLGGFSRFMDRLPHELSAGMRQIVALASVLASGATLALLDEPFSNLDALTREAAAITARTLLLATETTAIVVTHLLEEAVLIADKVIVLSPRPARVRHELAVTRDGRHPSIRMSSALLLRHVSTLRSCLSWQDGGIDETLCDDAGVGARVGMDVV